MALALAAVILFQAAVDVGAGPVTFLTLIPAKRLVALRRDPGVVVVDTRPGDEFAAGHIPGAVNIPLEFVAAKRFLAARAVVLVNNGFRRRPLLRARRRMLAAGFSRVGILDGGITAWRRNGGEMDGIGPDADFTPVTAADLYNELPRPDLIGLDLSGAVAGDDFSGRLRIERLAFSPDDPGSFQDAAASLAASAKGANILLMTGRGRGYAAPAAALSGLGGCVFALEGGIAAWREFRARVAAAGKAGKVAGERRCPVCPQ